MAKHNHNDDLFEQFFQKKAADYDIEFQEADWEKLERRLDEQNRLYVIRRRRIIAFAAALLLFALLGVFAYRNYQEINRLEQQLSQQTNQEQPALTQPPSSQPDTEETTQEPVAETPSPPLTSMAEAGEAGQDAAPNKTQAETISKSTAIENNNFAISREEAGRLSTSGELPQPNRNTALAFNNRITSDPLKPLSSLLQPTNPLSALANQSATRQADTEDRLSTNLTRQKYSGFSVSLALAPDFSTIGSLSNFYTPGYKLGATVEYSFNRNLALSVGFIYSNVKYQAAGSEYDALYGFWTNGIVPQSTTAQCALIDIPIQLKYNFWHFDRSRIYATAGFSSYIMLQEAYYFDYARQNEAGLVQSWEERTGTRHWMSNASFSIGYELDINPVLSLRVAPFLRLPLRDVGWGQVRLYSIGSMVSINYNFR